MFAAVNVNLAGPLRFALWAIVLPNLFFALPAAWLELGRPYINLDYLLVAALVLTRVRWLGYMVLAFAIAADLIQLIGQVFVFVRLQDLVYLLKFIALASAVYQALLLAGALVVVAMFFIFTRVARTGQLGAALFALNVGLLLYMALVVYSGEDVQNRFWRVPVSPLVSSPLVDVVDSRTRGFLQTFDMQGEAFAAERYKSQPNDWLAVPASTLNDRLLLIVNESWGVPVDPRVQDALLAPVRALDKAAGAVQVGTMPFVGATVAAEFRELCRIRPLHFNIANTVDGFERCLPNRLREEGYVTRAMHGAMSIMYDRMHWYPRVGFQHMTFFESKPWPARCRSFPGACDLDLIHEIPQEFAKPGKRFFYWLTLNSHSMYDARDIRVDRFDCAAFSIDPSTESCRNLKLQAQFFYALAGMLSDPRMKGVEVLVVGDHAPPIFKSGEKARYFEGEKVAWLHLEVK